MDGSAWAAVSAIVIALIAAVRQYYVQKATNAEVVNLTKRVREIYDSEQECQEARKRDERELLRALQENVTLRETLPKEMVASVSRLATQGDQQVEELQKIAASNSKIKDKLEEWPSDPKKDMCLLAELAKMAAEQSKENAKMIEVGVKQSQTNAELIEQIRKVVIANKQKIIDTARGET